MYLTYFLFFSGVVTTFGGTGEAGHSDGFVAEAKFSSPQGIATNNSNGDIYVSDTGNHTIRKISLQGKLLNSFVPPFLSFFLLTVPCYHFQEWCLL